MQAVLLALERAVLDSGLATLESDLPTRPPAELGGRGLAGGLPGWLAALLTD